MALGGADVRPPTEYRDYLLAVTFGYTKQQIDDSPAVWLDWMLACHGMVEQVKAEKQKEAQRG